jgi:hypothetical protein
LGQHGGNRRHRKRPKRCRGDRDGIWLLKPIVSHAELARDAIGNFESACGGSTPPGAIFSRMVEPNPHGCVGHVCQECRKCPWRAYPGAYHREIISGLGSTSPRDTCSRGERDVELTCAHGPRQRPPLAAQAPTRRRRSAAWVLSPRKVAGRGAGLNYRGGMSRWLRPPAERSAPRSAAPVYARDRSIEPHPETLNQLAGIWYRTESIAVC